MVDKITVTINTELTPYGEVIFSVKSHMGIYKRKCLHDALSDADIKMTGITDIVDTFRRKMKTVSHFSLETKHTRLYDGEGNYDRECESSNGNIESTVEASAPDISVKHRKSTRANKEKV